MTKENSRSAWGLALNGPQYNNILKLQRVVCKECKSVASNTGTIIDRDQKKRKVLEYFLEVHRG